MQLPPISCAIARDSTRSLLLMGDTTRKAALVPQDAPTPEQSAVPPKEDYKKHETDPKVWNNSITDRTSKSKDPWHPNLDRVVFYL
jgi:hypothetical protein